MQDYFKDSILNLYRRPDFTDIGYSDGDDAEVKLLDLMANLSDRSTYSEGIARGIANWPTEYHLSRARHCLLRPLSIHPSQTILEVGCGCGSLTRYLGEIGACVTGVEGSLRRASIAAARCSDLPNVTIFADNILSFASSAKYDWILLIGVLEYAHVFRDSVQAATECISYLSHFLKEDGHLVIGIENKLGLKYFNGFSEDHLGRAFAGIQGLYSARSPHTYGKKELQTILRASGFAQSSFLYPFPDHKLPSIVLTDAGLAHQNFHPEELLAHSNDRDYICPQNNRLFDETLVYPELTRNGLLGELSNSFLLVASRGKHTAYKKELLGVAYSSLRQAAFATETLFLAAGNSITVRKQRLYPHLLPSLSVKGIDFTQVESEVAYTQGRLLSRRVSEECSLRGADADLDSAFSPWFNYLMGKASGEGADLALYTIPGAYIDAVPFNLVETTEGLVVIDQEFKTEQLVPLCWVLFRGVLHTLAKQKFLPNENLSCHFVLSKIAESHGYRISSPTIRWCAEYEADLISSIAGLNIEPTYFLSPLQQRRRLGDEFTFYTNEWSKLSHDNASLQTAAHSNNALLRKQSETLKTLKQRTRLLKARHKSARGELAKIKSSLLWRISSPLRFICRCSK
jgi:SAM-dependent methyltransferase